MEPRITETFRYFFLVMLMILASQGIAQSLPKTTNATTLNPNTEIQAFTLDTDVAIDHAISFEASEQDDATDVNVTIDTTEDLLNDDAQIFTYFKVKKVLQRRKFAEESLFRKSYIA